MSDTSTDLFVVVLEDRHIDTEVEVWDDQTAAEQRARELVQENAHDPEYVDDEDEGLNEAMRDDGWTFFQRYSVESDSVRVVRRPLRRAT